MNHNSYGYFTITITVHLLKKRSTWSLYWDFYPICVIYPGVPTLLHMTEYVIWRHILTCICVYIYWFQLEIIQQNLTLYIPELIPSHLRDLWCSWPLDPELVVWKTSLGWKVLNLKGNFNFFQMYAYLEDWNLKSLRVVWCENATHLWDYWTLANGISLSNIL